jgi:hypothetical protein
MGALTPLAIVPHPVVVEFGDDMNFLQRFYNVHVVIYDMIGQRFWYRPRMQKMAEKYFANITGDYITKISI